MTMRKLTILVDMDCTMIDTLEAWTDELALRYRVVRHKEDITDWDLKKAYPMLSDEQIFAPLYTESMWKRVRPMPWAVESLWDIQKEGHRIVVVTSSPLKSLDAKIESALYRWFPYISKNDIIITQEKQLICGDVLIDDAPHNLDGGKYVGVLFDAPHNRSFQWPYRIKGWKEVGDMIRYIESGFP